MARLLRMAQTIRRNWKKSTVAFTILSYGVSYGHEKYKTLQLMRAYCEEAKLYGMQTLPQLQKPRHITVILNPVAHDKKAKSLYEKYSAPLLHLAGLKISIIQTENEGQSRDIMEIMANTDAVIVAGGDGTLHEAVTGLLRRPEYEDNVTSALPIGVIPVGKTNTVAKFLFCPKGLYEAQWIAEATMAVIRESTVALDVMKIAGEEGKPVYALSGFELGVFPDLEASLGKYWYFGPLKAKVAYVYNSIKNWAAIDDIDLEYVSPCDGCSRCFVPPIKQQNNGSNRWWSTFVPRGDNFESKEPMKDFSKISNQECGKRHIQDIPFSNIVIATSIKDSSLKLTPQDSTLQINVYPKDLSIKQFISTGLSYHETNCPEDSNIVSSVSAREIKLIPKEKKERWCYIDNENYEVQPVLISILPKHVIMYG